MKKIYYALIMVAVAGSLLISSCDRDRYFLEIPRNDSIALTIHDVRSIYQGKDIKLGKDINRIYGTVISDAASGNLPAGYLILQQGTTGIGIALKDSSAVIPFKPGDSVTVNVAGGALALVNGNLMITGPSLSDVTKLGEHSIIKPRQVLLRDLADNFGKYDETLIKIAAADIVPKPAAGETYSGSKNLYDGSAEAGAVKLYTSPGASFAGTEALPTATYTGIALYSMAAGDSGLQRQLRLRNDADIENTSIPLTSDIIITGIMANPRGSDEKVKGFVTSYSSTGVTIVHQGGYEYIQLMALRDIDFSKTPYSVVTCSNGAATSKGWAAGGGTTIKFNLTEGFAAQGTFFYVGASAKVIAGYWPTGLSTDISNANWIRSIDVDLGDASKVVGDGFGNSTTNLLSGSGPADGVAVFEGTEVTASSVPVDAVFISENGTASDIGSALTGSYGYKVPSSDLYSPVNKETGEAQPLFGQGTNTFSVAQVGLGDESRFAKMGGVVSQNAWIVPRHPVIVQLDAGSQLSDIEEGAGTTFFRK